MFDVMTQEIVDLVICKFLKENLGYGFGTGKSESKCFSFAEHPLQKSLTVSTKLTLTYIAKSCEVQN